MKIVTLVGARPQFIKAAAVSRVLRNIVGVQEIMVHSGQHYDPDMSDVFFRELDLPVPDYHLNVGSGTHALQTARILESFEGVLTDVQPDWVVVYGDTNTTLAGALAAAKLHIPVAHVEAGLRSFNRRMPEEINRVLTDHASDLLFAPTDSAVENLHREGIARSKIHRTGDVMFDAVLHYGDRAALESRILARAQLQRREYILATIHRAENTDTPKRLRVIIEALTAVARQVPVVVPLHPRTHGALKRLGLLEEATAKLLLLEPLGYLDMMMLERNARLVVTDSGGVQKEAFFFRVPCVTLRDETEWVELLESGWNRLVPPVSATAVVSGLMDALVQGPGTQVNPYGDGQAASAIAAALVNSRSGPEGSP